MQYHVLAYYLFAQVPNPPKEVADHYRFLEALQATARIYISEEGINGQACLHQDHVETYIEWMAAHPVFKEAVIKRQYWHEPCFPKLTVKYRKQLVALDEKVDMSKTATHLSPKEWKEKMELEKKPLLIDVRNDYETYVGHFEDSQMPPCNTFREFKQYTKDLKEKIDPATPIMMCCTGGIRCEVYSAYLKEQGFEEVYQLDGGIINYGNKEGSKHWKGKLFVFDDRLTVPISEEECEIVGKCHHCNAPIESYYNCANMDCNNLFLCCSDCIKEYKGCCQQSCAQAKRVRAYHESNPHKPFRKGRQLV